MVTGEVVGGKLVEWLCEPLFFSTDEIVDGSVDER